MTFTLEKLPYEYEALEPYISANTLKFHHDKHHQTYVDNLNKAITGTEYENMPLEKIIENTNDVDNPAVFNNAAQVYNHNFFFNSMKKNGGGAVPSEILKHFHNNEEEFLDTFKKAGLSQFGSGWVWLSLNSFGNIIITKTPNARNPLSSRDKPLLTVDVWEHAYYLDYQNRRGDFIDTFFKHLVNWDFVKENLK